MSTNILDAPSTIPYNGQGYLLDKWISLYKREANVADRVGERLGNYRLLRLLGQGGFAEVYLGEHIHLDTLAAIKVLHTRIDSDDVEHFRAESRTIARLVHPHIVRVLEYDIESDTPFLVVDYAPRIKP